MSKGNGKPEFCADHPDLWVPCPHDDHFQSEAALRAAPEPPREDDICPDRCGGRAGHAGPHQSSDYPLIDPAMTRRIEDRFWSEEGRWAAKGSGQTKEQQTGAAMVFAWLADPQGGGLLAALSESGKGRQSNG